MEKKQDKPKFKVGDILTVKGYNRSVYNGYAKVGSIITIRHVSEYYNDDTGHVYWCDEYPNGNYENELEVYKLAQTKLWKVLQ